MRHSFLLLAAASVAALTLSGCARNEAAEPKATAQLPQVTVAPVISRKVTEFDEFTGRFEAVERVEIRPRVSGYISSLNFTEGSEVRKGDLLFVIDPRPYVAERDKARAQLAQARSQLVLAKSERDRAMKLLSDHAISQEEFDTRTAGREQAQANVERGTGWIDLRPDRVFGFKVTSQNLGNNELVLRVSAEGAGHHTFTIRTDNLGLKELGRQEINLTSVAAREIVDAAGGHVAAPLIAHDRIVRLDAAHDDAADTAS